MTTRTIAPSRLDIRRDYLDEQAECRRVQDERRRQAEAAARSFVPRFAAGDRIVADQAKVSLRAGYAVPGRYSSTEIVTVAGPIAATVVGPCTTHPGYWVWLDGYTPPEGHGVTGPAYVAPSKARPAPREGGGS